MNIVKATELKNNLDKYLEVSIKEPVIVEKYGKKIAAIVSHDFLENLRKIEDAYWAIQALEAEKGGYLGADKSLEKLSRIAENFK